MHALRVSVLSVRDANSALGGAVKKSWNIWLKIVNFAL